MPDIRIRIPGYWPEYQTLNEQQQRVSLGWWIQAGAIILEPPFVPTYEPQQYVIDPVYGPQPISIFEFATEETAIELMHRFGAQKVVTVPYIENSPDSSPAKIRYLVWDDGTAVIAGTLAAFYTREPEDKFPDLARKQAEATIQRARTEKARLPGQPQA